MEIFYSDILMDDAENDPSGRPSRTRRPRQSSLASAGREREFNGVPFNGGSDLSSAVSGAAAAATNAAEDTEALLRKLRNLW